MASKVAGEHAAAQRAVQDSLLNIEETKPGIPPIPTTQPTEWAGQVPEAATAEQQTSEAEAERVARNHLKPTARKLPKRKANKAKRLDEKLTSNDWDLVYDSFQYSGDIDTIVDLAGLKRDEVDHLLNLGLLRLQLPAIREHAVDKAQLARDVQAVRQKESKALVLPDTKDAIQERVTQEAAAVQKALSLSIMGNSLLNTYAQKLNEAVANDALEMPERVTPELIKHFISAMEVHSRTIERIVKLQRLTQGQATDIVTQQIVGLIASCTTEELEEAEKHGRLPPTVVPASVEHTSAAQVIDVDYENLDDE